MGLIDFNRLERHHHEHSTTIIEKKAPTDESVRLLRDMEQKARDSIIGAVRIKDCPIDCVIHTHEDLLNGQKLFKTIYSVNGKKYVVDTTVDQWTDADEAAQKLVNDLACDIARTLIAPYLRSALKR